MIFAGSDNGWNLNIGITSVIYIQSSFAAVLKMVDEKSLETKVRRFQKWIGRNADFFKKNDDLRAEFVKTFPESVIRTITKERYSQGLNNLDTFCYWVEQKTQRLGSIFGSQVYKFGLWYSGKNKKYETTERYDNNPDVAIVEIRKHIGDLLKAGKIQDLNQISKNPLSPMFKGKILFLYFPDLYLNVFSEKAVDYFIKVLEVHFSESVKTVEEKRHILLQWKNSNPTMVKLRANEWTSDMFSEFLYREFKDEYGMIMKIVFNDQTGLDPTTYLNELESGYWDNTGWGTTKDIMKGGVAKKGRTKLLLYDTEKKAVTAEFEVTQVKKSRKDKEFPFKNKFSTSSVRIFEHPLLVEHIASVPGLENIQRAQGPAFKISSYQYAELTDSSVFSHDGRSEATAYPHHSEEADKELGNLGELFVMDFEKNNLRKLGHKGILLADKVEKVGDTLHYDIRSFLPSGKEIFIEVKTTVNDCNKHFYITHSEMEQSKRNPGKYFLYRVYNFDKTSKTGEIKKYEGNIADHFDFEGITFRAVPKVTIL